MISSNVNKPVVRKWVQALRSGNFQQTKSKLGEVNGDSRSYCCLGVLCELAAIEGVIPPGRLAEGEDEEGYDDDSLIYVDDEATPPPEVEAWISGDAPCGFSWDVKLNDDITTRWQERHGMNDNDYPGSYIGLVSLNDDLGLNFSQIADAIEETFLADEVSL